MPIKSRFSGLLGGSFHNPFEIGLFADEKMILGDLLESIVAIEFLGPEILRKDAHIKMLEMGFEPVQRDIDEGLAEPCALVILVDIEPAQRAGRLQGATVQ